MSRSHLTDQVFRIVNRVVGSGVGFRIWVPLAVAALLAAIPPGMAVAQDGPHSSIRISFTADRAALTVGDIVTLTLEVIHPGDHVVVVPRLAPEWGPFEVVSQTPVQTDSNADGTETTSQRMEVTIFAPGTFETPDLSISVRAPDGGVERVLPLPVRLTVDSVLSGPDETLKDIRPPADLAPPSWRQPVALAIAALAIVAVLVSGSLLVHRRLWGRVEQAVSAEDTRTPWEAAVQELDRIERLDLPEDGRFKEHYTLLAGVTRAYVRVMYQEDSDLSGATDMTTNEIRSTIGQSSLDRKNAGLVVDLLLEADLARFSNYSPSASQAYGALQRAREFVEGTKPVGEDARRQEGAYTQPEPTA